MSLTNTRGAGDEFQHISIKEKEVRMAVLLAGRVQGGCYPSDALTLDAVSNISSDHESDEGEEHSEVAMSEPEDEVVLSEDITRLTMEFTGMPRLQVIDLLLHNNGDPARVMAQVFP